ncbi:hypothetical protein CH375_16230 [Leptospira ellisii]|uniref:Uncharacterized protein n=1 Tax=Leptospira ellisii TaxID=2023197 RepID=A0A2N0BHU0_9LEPT|nr:hypothetical protein CH379_11695 [Leptospira ellisii]PKA03562.1 hypothetical protein CH375_16230 [Leptospira ellisii]
MQRIAYFKFIFKIRKVFLNVDPVGAYISDKTLENQKILMFFRIVFSLKRERFLRKIRNRIRFSEK